MVVGIRSHFNSLFKLTIKSVESQLLIVISEVDREHLLQLCRERFGHQNKRCVKKVISENLNVYVDIKSKLREDCSYGKVHTNFLLALGDGLHSRESWYAQMSVVHFNHLCVVFIILYFLKQLH